MLIKLSVENFKSYNELVEFSMIESNKYRDKNDHKIKIRNIDVLKHAVIYGANASGKSNLIEVFTFIKFCLKNEIPYATQGFFCKVFEENKLKPSKFEIQFSIKDKIYAYGFSVVLSERTIQEEWLYELSAPTNASMIFDRQFNQEIDFGKALKEETGEKNRLKTYSDDFMGNKTCLFLSEMNRNKKFSKESPLNVFHEVYQWLTQNIIVMTPSSLVTNFGYFYDDTTVEKVNELLNAFDTGISEAKIVEIGLEDLKKKLPEEALVSLMEDIGKSREGNNKPFRISMRSERDFFSIDVDKDGEHKITTLNLKHGHSFFDFSFEEESDGSRRIFDLLDMLLLKKEDVVFVVDELERSLHPKLTQQFLSLFSKIHSEHKTQLIFTTHEAAIMDQSLFRRDEIWFVERNQDNVSTIYSLDIFKERYDKKLSKAYLEGRYGAIPVFHNFDFGE